MITPSLSAGDATFVPYLLYSEDVGKSGAQECSYGLNSETSGSRKPGSGYPAPSQGVEALAGQFCFHFPEQNQDTLFLHFLVFPLLVWSRWVLWKTKTTIQAPEGLFTPCTYLAVTWASSPAGRCSSPNTYFLDSLQLAELSSFSPELSSRPKSGSRSLSGLVMLCYHAPCQSLS